MAVQSKPDRPRGRPAEGGSAENGSTAVRPLHPRLGNPERPVPELGGVCSYADAARPGLDVTETVALLKRHNWVETRLTDLFLTRLNSTPEWEVKGAFSLHLWLDAEHAKWIRKRVSELRHPPHRFEQVPDPGVEAFLQEALRSRDTLEVLTAIYRVIKPALLDAYRVHQVATNPLADQPTRRILRFIVLEEEEMIEWGERALESLLATATHGEKARVSAWEAHLRAHLAAAGGLLGTEPRPDEQLPPSRADAEPTLQVDWIPRRDARLESDNNDFPPHWVYAQRERPVKERMLALICKRLLEMDVPEMMAPIIWKTREQAAKAGKPKQWVYTADMARQVWDEARHSMLGEAWLVAHGIDWTQVPLNVGFSNGLNTLATPDEAHAALYWIEQGLMPRMTGKGYEYDVANEDGNPLAVVFQDFDWADEVLHVHIGRHIVEALGSRKEAERLGEEAFGRVMESRRRRQAEEGQEKHREWWTAFCETAIGLTPAPLNEEVMASQDAPWKTE